MTIVLLGFSAVSEFILWRNCRVSNRNLEIEDLWVRLVAHGRVRTFRIPKHAYPRLDGIRREVTWADFRSSVDVHLYASLAFVSGLMFLAALLLHLAA